MENGKKFIQNPRSSSTSSPKQQTGTKCRNPNPWLLIEEDKIEAAILQHSTFIKHLEEEFFVFFHPILDNVLETFF